MDVCDIAHRRVPPDAAQFRRFAGHKLYRHVELQRTGDSAFLFVRHEDAALDLGGIAAGYAVDRAVRALREHGITDGFINLSGDIYALGENLDGKPWRVGVRSPEEPDAVLAAIDVSDQAIATSGDYEQFFAYHGRRYHHIMDTGTGEPVLATCHSVTVTAGSCVDADAASTSVFGLDAAEASQLLANAAPDARVRYYAA